MKKTAKKVYAVGVLFMSAFAFGTNAFADSWDRPSDKELEAQKNAAEEAKRAQDELDKKQALMNSYNPKPLETVCSIEWAECRDIAGKDKVKIGVCDANKASCINEKHKLSNANKTAAVSK